MLPSTTHPPLPLVPAALAGVLVLSSTLVSGCHDDYETAVTTWHRNATSLTHAIPTTPGEQLALERAESVPPARTVVVLAENTVTYGETYSSASGRDCRTLAIEGVGAEPAARPRLLCREGEGWVLVPDLLESGSRDGPEDEL